MAGMTILVATMKSGHIQEAKSRESDMSHERQEDVTLHSYKKGWMMKLVTELNTVRGPIFLGGGK